MARSRQVIIVLLLAACIAQGYSYGSRHGNAHGRSHGHPRHRPHHNRPGHINKHHEQAGQENNNDKTSNAPVGESNEDIPKQHGLVDSNTQSESFTEHVTPRDEIGAGGTINVNGLSPNDIPSAIGAGIIPDINGNANIDLDGNIGGGISDSGNSINVNGLIPNVPEAGGDINIPTINGDELYGNINVNGFKPNAVGDFDFGGSLNDKGGSDQGNSNVSGKINPPDDDQTIHVDGLTPGADDNKLNDDSVLPDLKNVDNESKVKPGQGSNEIDVNGVSPDTNNKPAISDNSNANGLLPGGDGENPGSGSNINGQGGLTDLGKPDNNNIDINGLRPNIHHPGTSDSNNGLPSGGANNNEIDTNKPGINKLPGYITVPNNIRPEVPTISGSGILPTISTGPGYFIHGGQITQNPLFANANHTLLLPVYLGGNGQMVGGGSQSQNSQVPAFYVVLINGQATLVRNPAYVSGQNGNIDLDGLLGHGGISIADLQKLGLLTLPSIVGGGNGIAGGIGVIPQPPVFIGSQYPNYVIPSQPVAPETVPLQPVPQPVYPQPIPVPVPEINPYPNMPYPNMPYPNMPYPYPPMWPPMWDGMYPSFPNFNGNYTLPWFSKSISPSLSWPSIIDFFIGLGSRFPNLHKPVTQGTKPGVSEIDSPLGSKKDEAGDDLTPSSTQPPLYQPPTPPAPVYEPPTPPAPVYEPPTPPAPVYKPPTPPAPVPEPLLPTLPPQPPTPPAPVYEPPTPPAPVYEPPTPPTPVPKPVLPTLSPQPQTPPAPVYEPPTPAPEKSTPEPLVTQPPTPEPPVSQPPTPEPPVPQPSTAQPLATEPPTQPPATPELPKIIRPLDPSLIDPGFTQEPKFNDPSLAGFHDSADNNPTPNPGTGGHIHFPIRPTPSTQKPKERPGHFDLALINLLNKILQLPNRMPSTTKPKHKPSKINEDLLKILLTVLKPDSEEKEIKELLKNQSGLGGISELLLGLLGGRSPPNMNILVEPGMDEATRSNLILLLNLLASNLASDFSPSMAYYEQLNANPLLYFLGHFPCDHPSIQASSVGQIGQIGQTGLRQGLWRLISNMYGSGNMNMFRLERSAEADDEDGSTPAPKVEKNKFLNKFQKQNMLSET